MSKIDLNKLAMLITLIILALLATISGYQLEIGTGGIKFEKSLSVASPSHKS